MSSVLINNSNNSSELVEQRQAVMGMSTVPLKSLPLGFRFRPTDEELVNHYLKGKITGRIRSSDVIPEIDVCKCEPWDLPDKSLIQSDDPEWFFFAPKDRKYANGHRSNRATLAGYWKATGKDRIIRSRSPSAVIGTKKTLVFHCGRAPKGVRTSWIMHEYRTTEPQFESGDQGGYVLYRLFKKLEDKSSSSDAAEKSDICQTPSKSSPGDTQQELDTSEEFATPINQESSELDMQEDQQSLPGIVGKQSAGIEIWLADKSDCSTPSIKPEESHCNGNTLSGTRDHEAEVGAKVDSLLNALAQSCDPHFEWTDSDGFPVISSPVLPYTDYPFFHGIGPETNMESYLDGNGEQDTLNDFLNTVLSNDPFSEMEPGGNLSTTCVGRSNFGTNPGLAQVSAGSETSDWSSRPPIELSNRSPETEPHFNNIYESASLLPYDCAGQDVYSLDSTSEFIHDLFTSMDIPSCQRNSINNTDGLERTGIKIRARKPQNLLNSSNLSMHQDGGAIRRIRLQHMTEVESMFCEDSGSSTSGSSTSEDDNEEKVAVMKEEEHEENNNADRFLFSKNIGSRISWDEVSEKVAAIEGVEHTKNNNVARSFSCRSTGCSTNKDDIDDEVAAVEEGEHVENGNAKEEVSGPVDLRKLQNLSIIDGGSTNKEQASSDTLQESEPILRLRRKWNNVTGQRSDVSPLHQHVPRSVSSVVYSTRWVLIVIAVLVLSVGIWRFLSFNYVEAAGTLTNLLL